MLLAVPIAGMLPHCSKDEVCAVGKLWEQIQGELSHAQNVDQYVLTTFYIIYNVLSRCFG